MTFFDKVSNSQNEMKTTVLIDIDGVLVDTDNCNEDCDFTHYPHHINLRREKCPLMDGAKESLDTIKNMGLTIILFTSRVEEERQATEDWLSHHKLPYDRLVMNKPRSFIIIDDLAHKFTGWGEALHEIVYRNNKMEK